ncbi:unnamed protein product [Paramecium sonneborni]|uniref:Beta-hexosaminidase n=1 Tax=Paramecium sonneborni TaxID=65129 RepID=A0A8S1LCC7_9CILI|nr:unnamed protein product [Paramecium sonneborni]
MKLIIQIALLIICAYSLMPMPQQFNKGSKTIKIINKCGLSFTNVHNHPQHIIELLRHYHSLITSQNQCNFQMSLNSNLKIQGALKFHISLQSDEKLYWVNNTQQEAYILKIDEYLNINIDTNNHWGLARALDTVNQLIDDDHIQYLPLLIQDEPAYTYRGVMVDTARHFLPLKTLERTIDALAINKMNVMHWHITDDESFPLLLTNYSRITNTSKYSENEYYTKSDVSYLIEYASIRGVQIIPEIDSPAHVQSWGRNISDLENIILNCGSTVKQYGQFDPTLDLTYEVVKSVLQDLADMFEKVQFVHFGGDEAIQSCYNQRPSIKEFMNQHGIADYIELQTYYRQKQKSIWKNEIKSKKRIAYWYNKDDKLPADDDDIIHWWGSTEELSLVSNRSNDFILSDYHPLYLDIGVGNAFGNPYQTYQTWKDIYKWSPQIPEGFKGKIIGGEAPLWGETNNQNTHFQRLFLRSSILGDTLWNPFSKQQEQFYEFADRLGQMEDRMNKYGFPVSPFTHDYCKRHTKICFPILYTEQEQSHEKQHQYKEL